MPHAFPLLLVALVGCGGRSALDVPVAEQQGQDASAANSVPVDSGSAPSLPDASTGIDSGFQPPSCEPGGPGMTNCGPTTESCCTTLEVRGGTYYRTYDPTYDGGQPEFARDGGPTGLVNEEK